MSNCAGYVASDRMEIPGNLKGLSFDESSCVGHKFVIEDDIYIETKNDLPLLVPCRRCKHKYVIELEEGKFMAKEFRPYPLRHLAIHY